MALLLAFAVIAYLVATVAGSMWLSVEDGDTRRAAWRITAILAAALAVVAHAAIHAINWVASGGPDMHFFAALSLVGLAMAALTTATAWRQQLQALGAIVYPFAAGMLVLYHFFGHLRAEDLGWRLQLHAWTALLAYATLSLSALLALLLWAQERALRARQIRGWLRALPPLTQLEALLFRSIGAGFVLLTLTLVTGMLFVHDLLGQHLWHKTVLSILSWLAFGWLLLGRWRYGWRGPRAVKLTLAAMALLLLAFFGSKFVLELILHRSETT
ncbi:MAG: cytochrome c biogenesis protein CcsA [Proteobacteria bacterium]|nr:cytochrome c biogenesis protein CcsA [Pseudomonadota bacterium]